MKYVMLRHLDGTLFAVMALGLKARHSNMAAAWPGLQVVGAGFVKFHENGEAETYGFSQSLNRTPDANDARWLTIMYRAGLPTARPWARPAVGDKREAVSAAPIQPPAPALNSQL